MSSTTERELEASLFQSSSQKDDVANSREPDSGDFFTADSDKKTEQETDTISDIIKKNKSIVNHPTSRYSVNSELEFAEAELPGSIRDRSIMPRKGFPGSKST